ncbi:MAG: hypothetical protein EBX40_05720 [Gammaproteobacteria bacterium]|nr:hypothetical protein [Gammaproteobacteria bacterium]
MEREYWYNLAPLFEKEQYRLLAIAQNLLRNAGAFADNDVYFCEDEYCPPDTFWISPIQIFELSFYKVR